MSTPRTVRDGADGAVRVVRTVLLAAVTLAFSAGAHTMSGGRVPAAAGVLLLGSLTLVVMSVVGRWRLTPWTLVPTLIGLQSVLHRGFQALAVPTGEAGGASPATAPSAHHGHHGLHDLGTTTESMAGTTTPFAATSTSHDQPAMILAHLAAVAAITVLAVGADRALGRTVGRVARLFGAPARPIVMLGGPDLLVKSDVDAAPRTTLWMVAARPHRGPPPVLGAV